MRGTPYLTTFPKLNSNQSPSKVLGTRSSEKIELPGPGWETKDRNHFSLRLLPWALLKARPKHPGASAVQLHPPHLGFAKFDSTKEKISHGTIAWGPIRALHFSCFPLPRGFIWCLQAKDCLHTKAAPFSSFLDLTSSTTCNYVWSCRWKPSCWPSELAALADSASVLTHPWLVQRLQSFS